MNGLNKVIIIGTLGQDPEMRSTQGGTAVCNLSVATNEKWVKDGEKHESTEWHRVTMWNRLAEIAGEYLRKGAHVYIEGKLQTRKWQDRDGNDRYTTEIVAREMLMLGGGTTGNKSGTTGNGSERSTSDSEPPSDFVDDDIPF